MSIFNSRSNSYHHLIGFWDCMILCVGTSPLREIWFHFLRDIPQILFQNQKSHNITVIAFSCKIYLYITACLPPLVYSALLHGSICLSPCLRLLSALFGSQSAPFSSPWCVPHTLSVSRWLSVSDNSDAVCPFSLLSSALLYLSTNLRKRAADLRLFSYCACYVL